MQNSVRDGCALQIVQLYMLMHVVCGNSFFMPVPRLVLTSPPATISVPPARSPMQVVPHCNAGKKVKGSGFLFHDSLLTFRLKEAIPGPLQCWEETFFRVSVFPWPFGLPSRSSLDRWNGGRELFYISRFLCLPEVSGRSFLDHCNAERERFSSLFLGLPEVSSGHSWTTAMLKGNAFQVSSLACQGCVVALCQRHGTGAECRVRD